MSMRNMAVMFGAMAMLRRIDQEEPLVLLYVRIGYLVYVAITALMYIALHFRIIARRDMTMIEVPIAAKAPSITEAMEQARKAAEKVDAEKRSEEGEEDDNQSTTSTVTNGPSNNNNSGEGEGEEEEAEGEEEKEAEKVETISVMEYDLRHLANARRSWITSSCFLAAVHYHMQSVSPLFMSAVMGIIRLFTEDQLIQIHLRGAPAVDKLARPFTPEKNPLASMLKDFAPKEETAATVATSAGPTGIANNTQTSPDDELHDDGEDDDDDDDTPTAANTTVDDDHIKSDFDEDDDTKESSGDSKKDQ